GIMNGMGMAVFAIEVLFVQEILLLDARGFGFLFIAGAIGGVLGSQLAPTVTKRIGPGPSLYLCLLAGGVTLGVNGLTSNPWVFGAMFVVFSFTAVVWNVITVSLRQTVIPDRLLGRVNSVYRFFGWGSMPIGSLIGGLLVTLGTALAGREFGLRLPFLVAAVVHFLTFAVVGARLSTDNIEAAKAAAVHP
ncbi:MAG: MFS transporter, partial [Actinomycetota bacterium]|nr:MFS transporter [Actinomycetota bacterium]